MTFPDKFKHLLDITFDDLQRPDEAWLTYSVCAYDDDACGWQGWIIESVSNNGKQLSAHTNQRCPSCGKTLFRTEAALRLTPSDNQDRPLKPGRDYEVASPND